jgi:hypothetical protein
VANADGPAGDHQLLRAAVRCERSPQACKVNGGNEEVSVLRGDTEKLVTNSSTDEVRVQSERPDVVKYSLR